MDTNPNLYTFAIPYICAHNFIFISYPLAQQHEKNAYAVINSLNFNHII